MPSEIMFFGALALIAVGLVFAVRRSWRDYDSPCGHGMTRRTCGECQTEESW